MKFLAVVVVGFLAVQSAYARSGVLDCRIVVTHQDDVGSVADALNRVGFILPLGMPTRDMTLSVNALDFPNAPGTVIQLYRNRALSYFACWEQGKPGVFSSDSVRR